MVRGPTGCYLNENRSDMKTFQGENAPKDFEEELEVLAKLPLPTPAGDYHNSPLSRILRVREAKVAGDQIVITEKGKLRLKGPRTPCCGRTMEVYRGGGVVNAAVVWNSFNGVVECYACGEIYVPATAALTMLSDDEAPYRLWREAGGGMEQDRNKESDS